MIFLCEFGKMSRISNGKLLLLEPGDCFMSLFRIIYPRLQLPSPVLFCSHAFNAFFPKFLHPVNRNSDVRLPTMLEVCTKIIRV